MAENDTPEETDRQIEELLRQAGPRPQPSEIGKKRAYKELHAQWANQTRSRKPIWLGGVAAGLIAVVAVLVLRQPTLPVERIAFGNIALELGAGVSVSRSDETLTSDGSLLELSVGDRIETDSVSRVLIETRSGGSLRLDTQSQIQIDGPSEVRVLDGGLYFDSGSTRVASVDPALVVVTPAGRVRHIGTQYMVRVDRRDTTVGVREGIVEVSSPQDSSSIRATSGTLVPFQGATPGITEALLPTDGHWEWVMSISPPLAGGRVSAHSALIWIGRESGLLVRFAADVEARAKQIEVTGLEQLAPLEALELLAEVSGLEIIISDVDVLVR